MIRTLWKAALVAPVGAMLLLAAPTTAGAGDRDWRHGDVTSSDYDRDAAHQRHSDRRDRYNRSDSRRQAWRDQRQTAREYWQDRRDTRADRRARRDDRRQAARDYWRDRRDDRGYWRDHRDRRDARGYRRDHRDWRHWRETRRELWIDRHHHAPGHAIAGQRGWRSPDWRPGYDNPYAWREQDRRGWRNDGRRY